jgi:hypothetical protein
LVSGVRTTINVTGTNATSEKGASG